MLSMYNVQKLAENKFKNLVESLYILTSDEKDYEYEEISSGYSSINKIKIFAFFMNIRQKWDTEYFNFYMDIVSKLENPIELTSDVNNLTEVEYSELSEVMLNPDNCKLNLENKNTLMNFIVSFFYKKG